MKLNNLITKQVNFQGDNLIAVKDKNTGKVYTGISYICRGIGLTRKQKDRQVANIQVDQVLKNGCLKFDAGVFDPNNSTVAIDIDFLPLWLAKISITPKMQQQQPEIVQKLIRYQLKAKDVLAAAFIKKQLSPMEQLRLQYQVIESHEEKINELDTKVRNLALTMNITDGQAKTIQKLVNKRVKTLCCGNESSAYMNSSIRKRVYSYIWRTLKDYLNVSVYHNILRKDYSSAIKYIDTITLQGALFREVQEINQQINIKEAAI